jgi:5-formyltetrahydrofolate cyclo-ligase
MRLREARRGISPQQQVTEAGRLIDAVPSLAVEGTVSCYVPFGSEPGAVGLLDALLDAGARVLLPVVPDGPEPLDWAEYTGTSSLVAGRYRGMLEPSGTRLGPAAIAEAGLVLVPALAVDHEGVRLGRGAGYYDRSLGFTAPDARLVAVVRDGELVERLPAEPHDVRMTGALTPAHGLVTLPRQVTRSPGM